MAIETVSLTFVLLVMFGAGTLLFAINAPPQEEDTEAEEENGGGSTLGTGVIDLEETEEDNDTEDPLDLVL